MRTLLRQRLLLRVPSGCKYGADASNARQRMCSVQERPPHPSSRYRDDDARGMWSASLCMWRAV